MLQDVVDDLTKLCAAIPACHPNIENIIGVAFLVRGIAGKDRLVVTALLLCRDRAGYWLVMDYDRRRGRGQLIRPIGAGSQLNSG